MTLVSDQVFDLVSNIDQGKNQGKKLVKPGQKAGAKLEKAGVESNA